MIYSMQNRFAAAQVIRTRHLRETLPSLVENQQLPMNAIY